VPRVTGIAVDYGFFQGRDNVIAPAGCCTSIEAMENRKSKKPACFLILNSVYDVMKAEKELLKHGISLQIIPTPREISHDCGVVLRFDCGDIDKIKNLVDTTGFSSQQYFRKDEEGKVTRM
jgi:hypothetical protein